MRSERSNVQKNSTRHEAESVILSILLTTLLTTSFTLMVTSAYMLKSTFSILIASTIVFSVIFAYAHHIAETLELKYLSPGILILTPIISLSMIGGDCFYSLQAFRTLLFCIGEYSFPSLNIDPIQTYLGTDAMTPMFNLINLITIAYTTYFLTRKKFPIIALLFYVPYMICSLSNYVMVPRAIHLEIAAASIIILVIVHVTRKHEHYATDEEILKISIPVLLIVIVLGFIFPQNDNYDKDIIANSQIYSIRNAVLQSRFGSNEYIRRLMDLAAEGRSAASNPNNAPVDDAANISVDDTYFYTVGHLNQTSYRICDITLMNNNHADTPLPLYNINFIYLKVDSKDTYSEEGWTSAGFYGDIFDRGTYFTTADALYMARIDYIADSDVELIPYYSDLYAANGGGMVPANSSYVYGPYTSTSKTSENGYFGISTLPVRVENEYSDEYLEEYVYGTNLAVPDSTRQAIIDTGMLPDRYMQVLNGELEMSDADKVRMVTEFVRDLHPYSKDTDYPAEGTDFVAWFMSESTSGFCVHYATTATILLRMIGVPTRYVNGYLAEAGAANVTRSVYSTDAHAWFEFFDPEFGWIIGDPTPGNVGAVRNYDIDALAEIYPEYAPQDIPSDPAPDETSETSATDITDNSDNTDTSDVSETTQTTQSAATTSAPSATTSAITSTEDETSVSYITNQTVSGHTSDSDEADKEVTHPSDILRIIGIVLILLIISALIIARMMYVIYWKRRFSAPGVRARIIAYYRYFKLTGRFLNGRPTKKALTIAERAAFSQEKLTEDDLKQLIDSSLRATDTLRKKLPAHKRLIFNLITVRFR